MVFYIESITQELIFHTYKKKDLFFTMEVPSLKSSSSHGCAQISYQMETLNPYEIFSHIFVGPIFNYSLNFFSGLSVCSHHHNLHLIPTIS